MSTLEYDANFNTYEQFEPSSLDFYRRQATSIYRYLLRRGKPMDLDKIIISSDKSARHKANHINQVLSFANDNMPNLFEFKYSEDRTIVTALVTIQFCKEFESKIGCQRLSCPNLHVCRHYIKDKCTFGARCKKPHHFKSEHTARILHENLLHDMDDLEIKSILCRNVQFSLDDINLQQPKQLQVCQYYNVKIGCCRGDSCPYLHICKFFITCGVCKFGEECIRNHDFNTKHCQNILKSFGIGEDEALIYLRENTPLPLLNNMESISDDLNDNYEDSNRNISLYHDFNMKESMYICCYHLKGKCYAGSDCPKLHLKQLYTWQIKAKNDEKWSFFNELEIKEMEEKYCNPFNQMCIINWNEKDLMLSINFESFTATVLEDVQSLWQKKKCISDDLAKLIDVDQYQVRRLSTLPQEEAITGEAYATKWNWYFQDANNNWQNIKCTTAELKNFVAEKYPESSFLWEDQIRDFVCGQFKMRQRPQFMDMQTARLEFERFRAKRTQEILSGKYCPTSWVVEKDPTLEFVQVPLDNSNIKYIELEQRLQDFVPGALVMKITKLQNYDLWKDYQRKKQDVINTCMKEIRLYYAATSRKIRSIYQQGFPNNKDAALNNNHEYYNELSCSPYVEHLQTMEDSRGYRHIFVAKAMVLNTYENTRLPDAMVTQITNRSHLYPEYLISYVVKNNHNY